MGTTGPNPYPPARARRRPSAPPDTTHLTITVVEDPLRVRHGFPISSTYVETFWLSHLGPSAVSLLRLFDRFTRHRPDRQATLSLSDLGTIIGTPGTGNASMIRRIDRLTRFGAARRNDTDHPALTVWSHLDTVPLRLQARWPDWLTDAHTRAVTDRKAR